MRLNTEDLSDGSIRDHFVNAAGVALAVCV